MKFCTNCGESIDENAQVCPKCGTPVGGVKTDAQANGTPVQPDFAAGQQPYMGNPAPVYQQQVYAYDPSDHTSEMDAQDIADHKTLAISMYVFSWVGMFLAVIAAKESKYVQFHLTQVLKYSILQVLVGIVTIVLCWTLIVPVVAGIFSIVLFIVRIIGFVNACSGKAKELPVVSAFKFL